MREGQDGLPSQDPKLHEKMDVDQHLSPAEDVWESLQSKQPRVPEGSQTQPTESEPPKTPTEASNRFLSLRNAAIGVGSFGQGIGGGLLIPQGIMSGRGALIGLGLVSAVGGMTLQYAGVKHLSRR